MWEAEEVTALATVELGGRVRDVVIGHARWIGGGLTVDQIADELPDLTDCEVMAAVLGEVARHAAAVDIDHAGMVTVRPDVPAGPRYQARLGLLVPSPDWMIGVEWAGRKAAETFAWTEAKTGRAPSCEELGALLGWRRGEWEARIPALCVRDWLVRSPRPPRLRLGTKGQALIEARRSAWAMPPGCHRGSSQ